MIVGRFTEFNEFVVSLEVRNDRGERRQVEAIIDTGFTEYLVLPTSIVQELNLPQIDEEQLTLANGDTEPFAVHTAVVLWNAQEHVVPAYAAEGDALLGIEMLRGSTGTFQFFTGGTATIFPGP